MIDLGLVEFREDHTEPPFRKAHLRPVPDELFEDDELPDQADEDGEQEDLGLQVMGSVIYKQSQVTIRLFRQIMGDVKFNNPKDHEILARIFNYVTNADPKAIFLDAFSGSGTTGHSVLDLNRGDGGARRFILIESENKYINALTCERLTRVIEGVAKAKDENLRKGLGGSFSFVEVGHPMHLEACSRPRNCPPTKTSPATFSTQQRARILTARRISRKTGFIGESAQYDVYLLYEPDLDYLKNTRADTGHCPQPAEGSGKKRLVFAPTKYLDSIHLDENRIEFCQLPFEIYKAVKRNP